MAKVDEPKLPGWDEPPLPYPGQGPGSGRSFFRQLSLLHIMISLVYFAILFWAFRQIMLTDGYAQWVVFGVLVGMGFCLVGLWAAAKLPRYSFVGWGVFVVGYITIMGVTTTFFAIPALPILIGSIVFVGLRRRANNQDALIWVLAVAAERGMPLGPGVQAFSGQVSGIYHVWAEALAELLHRGMPLPDALDSLPRLVPKRSALLIRTGWESGNLALGLKESVAAREAAQPVLHAVGGRMAYLGWVSAVALFIVSFVMYFVVPKFEAIFKDFGLDLPEVTKLVIHASHVAINYSWVFVLACLLALIYGMIAILVPGRPERPAVRPPVRPPPRDLDPAVAGDRRRGGPADPPRLVFARAVVSHRLGPQEAEPGRRRREPGDRLDRGRARDRADFRERRGRARLGPAGGQSGLGPPRAGRDRRATPGLSTPGLEPALLRGDDACARRPGLRPRRGLLHAPGRADREVGVMIASRPQLQAGRRPGFGLIEMAVAGVLIVVAMTVTVQVVGWIALERKAVERRERSLLEAENLLERIVATPWGELTTESAARFRVSEATAKFLRNPTLGLAVAAFDDAPARKKVSVELRWLDRSGRPEAPVRLVAWTYRRGEAP